MSYIICRIWSNNLNPTPNVEFYYSISFTNYLSPVPHEHVIRLFVTCIHVHIKCSHSATAQICMQTRQKEIIWKPVKHPAEYRACLVKYFESTVQLQVDWICWHWKMCTRHNLFLLSNDYFDVSFSVGIVRSDHMAGACGFYNEYLSD